MERLQPLDRKKNVYVKLDQYFLRLKCYYVMCMCILLVCKPVTCALFVLMEANKGCWIPGTGASTDVSFELRAFGTANHALHHGTVSPAEPAQFFRININAHQQ